MKVSKMIKFNYKKVNEMKWAIIFIAVMLSSGCAVRINTSVATSTSGTSTTTATATSVSTCPGYTQPTPDFTITANTDIGDAVPGDGICDDGGGDCSLRAAVEESDALGGGKIIKIPAGLTIVVGAKIVVGSSVTIVGGSPTTSIVSGGNAFQILQCGNPGLTIGLHNFTLQNANAATDGGAFFLVGGTVNVSYMTFKDNVVTGGGGAITIDNNFGNLDPSLTVSCSTFSSNSAANGGAIAGGFNQLSISDTVFKDNQASALGAGAWFGGGDSGGVHTLTRVLFQNNTGASTGGALVIDGTEPTTATITNTTFYGNSATQAAVMYTDNSATVNFYNVTMLSNVGGGSPGDMFRQNTGGVFTIANSILWDTSGPSTTCSIAGTMNSLGNNIFDDSSNCTTHASDSTTNPGLSVPASNGGYSDTASITAGGSADGTGSATYCPTVDQRNYFRATTCDIGAYENQ